MTNTFAKFKPLLTLLVGFLAASSCRPPASARPRPKAPASTSPLSPPRSAP